MAAEFDYVVVGSGAGGGPLASRLARDSAGYRVALIESGVDPSVRPDGSDNYSYAIPALHGRATEDEQLRWDFFVRHYSGDRQDKDSKINPPNPPLPGQPVDTDPRHKGIWYPRAGTIGGCTAHNAMITIYPHHEDWEYLRQLTDDDSWSADNMRRYFENLEDCRYAPMSPNAGRHGFGNWLATSLIDLKLVVDVSKDPTIVDIAAGAVTTVIEDELLALAKNPDRLQRVRFLLSRLNVLKDVLASVRDNVPVEHRNALDRLLQLLDVSPDRMQGQLDFVAQHLQSLTAATNYVDQVTNVGDSGRKASDDLINHFLQEFVGGMPLNDFVDLVLQHIDPNDWRLVEAGMEGIFPIPLATDGVRRISVRDFVQDTVDNCPYRLELITEALVTKVVFDGTRAVGVKLIRKRNAYCASPQNPDRLRGTLPPLPHEEEIRARREVILACGTFNTPQLLMLSGIGPQQALAEMQIAPVRPDMFWPGVGQNLQDRYELAVISEMQKDFEALKACRFDQPVDEFNSGDPCFDSWKNDRTGVYTTNGALFGVIKRSQQAEHIVKLADHDALPPPDLFIFGLLGFFKGYYPSYSCDIAKQHNVLTWAVLKAHTRNSCGEVRLRSADPRETPLINFKSFNDGDVQPGSGADKDVRAIIEAVAFIKRMLVRTGKAVKVTAWPDLSLDRLDDAEHVAKLREFILNEAWGHHACGTCKIGKSREAPEQAVVDGTFKVLGLQGLRIVDASVFPKIPGFFIVTPIYMIAEKAAEIILHDAKKAGQ